MAKQGVETSVFGHWMCENIETQDGYRVYFDHGDSTDSHVVATKSFFGDQVSNENRLADVDAIVVDNSGEIAALIEIAERPLSPKKLLGVALAVLISDNICIMSDKQQITFKITDNTKFLIAGNISSGSQSRC